MVERSRVETQIAIDLGTAERQVRQVAQKREVVEQRVSRLSTRVNEILQRVQVAERRAQAFRSRTAAGVSQIGQQVAQLAILEGLHLGSSLLGGAVQPLAQIATTTAFAAMTTGVPGAVTAFIFTSLSQLITIIRTQSQKVEAIVRRFDQLDQDTRDIRNQLRIERAERIEREIRERELAALQAEEFVQETIWRVVQVESPALN